jgi:glyoxylase-like metal-dependent hydrolase (beta-lactamase superfamily II)
MSLTPNKPASQQAGFFVANADPGIITVDTHHVRPKLDASHLIIDGGRVAIVDTGTALGVPYILAALAELDIEPHAVDYILLTHIHLDHAGGAGALLKHLPNANVMVHPRGARHLVDPSRLIAATIEVYGKEFFAATYGNVVPIAAERVISSDDGHEFTLGNRTLSVWHSPGHAIHHQVFVDQFARVIIAGDAFGVSYRELDFAGKAFIIPATTPSQLDPPAMMASIERIAQWHPQAVYVTHYSRLTEIKRLTADLIAGIQRWSELTRQVKQQQGDLSTLKAVLSGDIQRELAIHSNPSFAAQGLELLTMDIDLDAQGLWHWVNQAVK